LDSQRLHLAAVYGDDAREEEARQIVQPLLHDQKAPLYADARDWLCETYYKPASDALQRENWIAARQGFEAVLKINSAYRDSIMLLREAYLRPAKHALDTKYYDASRLHLESWLK